VELCLLVEEAAEAYLSVRAPSDDDVWVVGTEAEVGVSGPAALRWDGAAWERLDLSEYPGTELWWVHPGDETTTMVGTEGLLLEYDRTTGATQRVEGPDAAVTFFGVWGTATDNMWAVGGDVSGGVPGQIWRRDAEGWSSLGQPEDVPASTIWFKVDGKDPDDVWIVGSQGQVLHWDGASLVTVSANDVAAGSSLFTVDAQGDEVIAVGGTAEGHILHYVDGEWVERAPASSPGINGVCVGAGTAVAVGGQGAMYRGGAGLWEYELAGLTLRDYHACAVSPSGSLWAVGGQIVSRPLNAGLVAYAGANSVAGIPSE